MNECMALHLKWMEGQEDKQGEEAPSLLDEQLMVKRSLSMFEELGLKGGIIKINEKIEAFTIAELIDDMIIIHLEKANASIQGMYPLINREFLRNTWQEAVWVNREEDMGIEGLRKAKQSYYPHHMLYKYTVTLRKPNGKRQRYSRY